jgi:hypothetical protein
MAAIALGIAGCALPPRDREEDPLPIMHKGEVLFLKVDFRQANVLDLLRYIQSQTDAVLPANARVKIGFAIDPENPNRLLSVDDMCRLMDSHDPADSKLSAQCRRLMRTRPLVTFLRRYARLSDLLDEMGRQTGLRWDCDASRRNYRLYDPETMKK